MKKTKDLLYRKESIPPHKTYIILSILVIILFGVTFTSEVITMRAEKQALFQELQNNLKTTADYINNYVNNLYKGLEIAAFVISKTDNYNSEFFNALKDEIQNKYRLDSIFIIDKDGFSNDYHGFSSDDFTTYSFYQNVLKNQNSLENLHTSQNNIPYMVFSVPVVVDGNVSAVLCGSLNSTNFQKDISMLGNYMYGQSDDFIWVSQNGTIMYTSNESITGNFFELQDVQDGRYVYESIVTADKIWFIAAKYKQEYIDNLQSKTIINLSIIACITLLLTLVLIYLVMRQQHLISDLNKANIAKSDFLAHVSHDIRTPLNAIIGITSLAIEESDTSIKQEYLQKINDSGKYLLGLINDTLDMSKIENRKIILRPSPVCFSDIEEMVKTIIQPRADEKNIKLVINQENLQPYIMIDKLRIEQILINLLNNAVKFTPENGTITFSTIALSHTETEVHYRFSIRDTGVGMSEEFMQKMFLPFEQERNRLSVENSGTGLGLAIVKSLVEMMGGTISCTSRKNSGTKFIVELRSLIATTQEIQAHKHEMLPEDDSIFRNKCILVAEDNSMNVLVTRKLLERKQILVETVDTGKKALEMFCASELNYYDAILMDIHMPEMDGLRASQEIRKQQRSDAKTVPIVALTANAYEEDVKESLQAGMNGHVAKPIEPIILFTTLKNIFVGAKDGL